MLAVLEEERTRAFIPPFIHDNYRSQQMVGEFEAITLFVDISGFTKLTATLMQYRRDGAEVLTTVLNRVYDSIIYQVYAHGGFITSFAGDAFTAVFPAAQPDVAAHAIQTAFFIRDFFEQQGVIPTKYDTFFISVKIGLGCGPVKWQIVPLNATGRLTYYFYGDGIDSCLTAEKLARRNEIIVTARLESTIKPYTVLEPIGEQVKLHHYNGRLPEETLLSPPLNREIMAQFTLEDVLNLPSQAEFRDVCNIFISFTEPQSSEALIRFVATVAQKAESYGGYFNKIDCGDKGWVILLLFGAPMAYENSLERALECLLSLQRQPFGTVQWRAGLTMGTVYAGVIGSQTQCEYTAIGSMVNLAARLMVQAPWNMVWVPDQIARHPGFKFAHQDDLLYKGFAKPIATYALQGQRIEQKFFDLTLIGRQTELAQLHAQAEPIFQGQFAGITYVYGEGGIGKSHLAYRFHKAMAREKAFTWLSCQTDQILQNAFNPFSYFLKQYFQQSGQDSVETNRVRFEQKLNRLVQRISQLERDDAPTMVQELRRAKSMLGALVGLRWPESLYEELDAQGRYENTLFAVKTLILAESCLHPVILLIEDAHWLDKASEALLATLTRNIATYPLFIIATLRYADDGSKTTFAIDKEVVTHHIELAALADDAIQTLAMTHLRGAISNELYERLLDRTQGNPFYAQQYLYYFTENDLLERREGLWHLKRGDKNSQIELPATINAILVARIDRLTQNAKEVVKTAAVLGHEFDMTILSEIIRGDLRILENNDQLPFYVEEAKHEQIWTNLTAAQYIFKHALLRDSAYEMQLRTRLRKIHRLAGRAYEVIYAANLQPHYAMLAYHFQQGGLTTKARYYLIKAGQAALSISDYHQAVTLLSSAVDLFDSEETAVELYEQKVVLTRLLGQAYTSLGFFDKAVVQLEESLYLARQTRNEQGITSAQRELGFVLASQGKLEQAKACLLNSLQLGQRLAVPDELAHILYNLGFVMWRLEFANEAIAYVQDSLFLSRRSGNRLGIARALTGLGNIALMMEQVGLARNYFEEGLQLSRELGNRSGLARVLNNLAIVVSKQANYERAQRLYQEALNILREIDNQPYLAMCLNDLGRTTLQLQDYELAHTYIYQSLEVASAIDSAPFSLMGLVRFAELMLEKGVLTKAVTYLSLALNHPATYGDVKIEAEPLLARLKEALPSSEYKSAFEIGSNLDLDEVLSQIVGK